MNFPLNHSTKVISAAAIDLYPILRVIDVPSDLDKLVTEQGAVGMTHIEHEYFCVIFSLSKYFLFPNYVHA